jgi:hypothetical protein
MWLNSGNRQIYELGQYVDCLISRNVVRLDLVDNLEVVS